RRGTPNRQASHSAICAQRQVDSALCSRPRIQIQGNGGVIWRGAYLTAKKRNRKVPLRFPATREENQVTFCFSSSFSLASLATPFFSGGPCQRSDAGMRSRNTRSR